MSAGSISIGWRSLLALLLAASCSTLAPAPPHAFIPAPASSAPVTVCWLELGGTTVDGSFGAGGSTRAARWEVTSSALLIRHPKGTLLIDAGISPHAARDAQELGPWGRFVFDQTAGRNEVRGELRALLDELGVKELTAVVLSHAHADHAGGLVALPDVPVWVGEGELALIQAEALRSTGTVLPAHARAMASRLVPIPFEAKGYENFDEHWDVFGDGAVVLVPTPGHTPGSVATFVTISAAQRLVHVGDVINLEESLERRVGKSWLMRRLTDEDGARTELEVRRLIQLHELDPALTILPAHDRPAWQRLFGAPRDGVPPCLSTPRESPGTGESAGG